MLEWGQLEQLQPRPKILGVCQPLEMEPLWSFPQTPKQPWPSRGELPETFPQALRPPPFEPRTTRVSQEVSMRSTAEEESPSPFKLEVPIPGPARLGQPRSAPTALERLSQSCEAP